EVSQPILVPVNPQSSRRYCTRSVRGSTSWDCDEPLTVIETCTSPPLRCAARPDAIRGRPELSLVVRSEQIRVLRVLVDERGDIPTRRDDVPAARADVVERRANELGAEPAAAQGRVDLSVVKDEDVAPVHVLGDAHHAPVPDDLVPGLLGDAPHLSGH